MMWLALLLLVGHREPSPGCERIKDRDERQLCRALTSGDGSYCESIRDEQRRELCRAETRR